MRSVTEKYISIALGAVLLASAVAYSFGSNFTVGTAAAYILGLALLSYGVFHKKLSSVMPKWLKRTCGIGLLFIFVFVACIYLCGSDDNVTYDEDVIIVLGAGIKGETIGRNLQARLDTALEYYRRNGDAYIAVSGGQGPYEDITEALAMERYLISKGVPAGRIIKEERSTSTEENLRFTKEILDSRFDSDYSVAIVSNSFHIYRASVYAQAEGFDDVTHIHAKTPWHTTIPNGLREMLAILKMWIFD